MSTFIHRLRVKHRYSQEDIARIIGVSRQTFAQIERGESELSVSQIKRLVNIFGYKSIDSFLSEEDEKDPIISSQIAKEASSSSKKTFSFIEENNEQSDKIETKEDRRNPIAQPIENVDLKKNKLREIILFILCKIGGRPNVGEGVLSKLLYFIDFDYFERYKKQIIGIEYIKNHHGPYPSGLSDLIADMERKHELIYIDKKHFKFQQKKYLPLREPNLELLSGKEIEHINWVIFRLAAKSVKEIEEYSQRDIPWVTAGKLSVLDYKSVFYRTPEFSIKEALEDV